MSVGERQNQAKSTQVNESQTWSTSHKESKLVEGVKEKDGRRGELLSDSGQRESMKVNDGQRRSTKVNESLLEPKY